MWRFILFTAYQSVGSSSCADEPIVLPAAQGEDNLSQEPLLKGVTAKAEYVQECLNEDKDPVKKYDDSWYDEADRWIKDLMQMDRTKCVQLKQEHFQAPAQPLTVMDIGKPQCYVLTEDVEVDFGRVDHMSDLESPVHHGVPFVIRVLAQNVLFDLQGHIIKMSERYFNWNPFASIFDLAEFPLPGARLGYPEIGKWANRTIIHNGTIGLSSHFGIHGNNNEGVLISRIRIENFGVAGIHFNAACNVSVEHVVIDNSRFTLQTDPDFGFVLETYRKAKLFAKDRENEYVNVCPSTTDDITYDQTRKLIGLQIESILEDEDFKKILEDPTKNMPAKKPEPAGNIYGIFFVSSHDIHKFNVESSKGKSRNVRLVDIEVKGIKKGNDEAKTLWFGDNLNETDNDLQEKLHWKDFIGHRGDYSAICDDDGNFREPNFKTKLQIARLLLTDCEISSGYGSGKKQKREHRDFYSSVILNLRFAHSVGPNNSAIGFSNAIGSSCRQVTDNAGFRPLTGFDQSGHVSKGLVGIRVDQVNNIKLEYVTVDSLHNKADFALTTVVGENKYGDMPPLWKSKKHSAFVHKGNFAYGVTVSGSSKVHIRNTRINSIKSDTGSVFGITLMGENKFVDIHTVVVSNLYEGLSVSTSQRESLTAPNLVPIKVPYFVDATKAEGIVPFSDLDISTVRPNAYYAFTGNDCDNTRENPLDEICKAINVLKCTQDGVSLAQAECATLPPITVPTYNSEEEKGGKSTVLLIVIIVLLSLLLSILGSLCLLRTRLQRTRKPEAEEEV